jgi:curli biogenesis system outer membrane secretion channel CsgG
MKYAFVAVLAVAILAALVVYAAEEQKPAPGPAAAAEPTKLLPPEPEVVAAIPYKSETEYEQDPFDQTKLRRTHTVVTHVLIVRSDGKTTIKPAQ